MFYFALRVKAVPRERFYTIVYLVEGSEYLLARVRLEVVVHNAVYHETLFCRLHFLRNS